MSKRIIIIAKYACSKQEGFETRTFALARKFVKKGHEVDIFTSDSNHLAKFPTYKKLINKDNIDGINVYWIKTLKYRRTGSIRRVLSWFDFEIKFFIYCRKFILRPDVIITSSLSPFSILNGVLLKNKFNNAKLICEIRDIWPLTLIEEGGYSKYHPFSIFLSIIEKFGYRKSDVVVGTMPNLKEHVHNLLNNKSLPVYCIPFGLEPNDYKLDSKSLKKDRDLINLKAKLAGKFTIGYAGSIGLSNGLNSIINLIEKFNETNKEINFIFLGDGAYKRKYQKQLINCDNVFFTGKIKREMVKYYLDLFDILYFSALPSKVWNYGWSLNKMTDYMMAGKPVLASYNGYRSMINEAKSGFFVESNNDEKLKKIILDISKMKKKQLDTMGERGKRWIIKNRKWDDISDNYIDIF